MLNELDVLRWVSHRLTAAKFQFMLTGHLPWLIAFAEWQGSE
jgi:hypothetical protein